MPSAKSVENIIGNLDENGYLTASNEELARTGSIRQDDIEIDCGGAGF